MYSFFSYYIDFSFLMLMNILLFIHLFKHFLNVPNSVFSRLFCILKKSAKTVCKHCYRLP